MAFDQSKDVEILSMSKDDLMVSLRSYDKGEIKVQISRSYRGEWTKLGRLTLGEAQWVASAINELIANLTIMASEREGMRG